MNKLVSFVLAGAFCASLAFGADFSKKSNDDLAKMAGTVAPKDVPDYMIELHKRMKKMKREDARKFHKALEEAMQKNTDDMTLKEFRERKAAIREAIEKKKDSMTKEQIRESGLDRRMGHKRDMHPDHGPKKGHERKGPAKDHPKPPKPDGKDHPKPPKDRKDHPKPPKPDEE